MNLKSPYVTLSYKQLADAFGNNYHATMQCVERHNDWYRIEENDGSITIKIPRDYFDKMSSGITKNSTSDATVTHNSTEILTYLEDVSQRLDNLANNSNKLSEEKGALQENLRHEKHRSTVLSRHIEQQDKELNAKEEAITDLKEVLRKEQSRSWWRRLFGVP